MARQSHQSSGIEPLIPLLETKVIPWWERCSLDNLAVTAPTLEEFKQQALPERMRTSVKKRTGKKTSLRGKRNFNNTNSYRAFWRENDQAVYSYPALVFILTGQADFHIADYVVHCPQDHFLLFRDNVPRPVGTGPHFEGENTDQRYCAVLWFFTPPGTNSVVGYVCYSRGKKHWSDEYRIVHRQDVIHSFNIFIREVQERAAGYQRIAHSSFQAFLYLFLRELQERRFLGAVPASSPVRGSSSIEQAKEYVKDHLNQPLTASRVAHEIYMSRNSFIRQFTRETGQTFHEFVTSERMEKAHRLLSEGYWSIDFVCHFVGLKPTRFRAQFLARFKMTPSEFRKQLQTKVQKR